MEWTKKHITIKDKVNRRILQYFIIHEIFKQWTNEHQGFKDVLRSVRTYLQNLTQLKESQWIPNHFRGKEAHLWLIVANQVDATTSLSVGNKEVQEILLQIIILYEL